MAIKQVGPAPVNGTDAVTKAYADMTGVPVGGTSGQVLAKTSGTDYATGWTTPAGGSSTKQAPSRWAAIASTPFTAVVDTAYVIDTTSTTGGISITLPASAPDGGTVAFVYGKFSGQLRTVNLYAASGDLLRVSGSTGGTTNNITFPATAFGVYFRLVYNATTKVWESDFSQNLPLGGATGQVLSKKSGLDLDTQWTTPAAGGTTKQVPSKWGADITANFTAAADTAYVVNNTSGGSINTTLPTAPPDNTAISFIRIDGTTDIWTIVTGAGDMIRTISAGGSSVSSWIAAPRPVDRNCLITLVYAATSKMWSVAAAPIEVANPAMLLPAAGTAGQVLIKNTNNNYDAGWVTPTATLPTGGNTGQVLAKKSGSSYDVQWINFNSDGGWKTLPIAGSYSAYANTPAPAYRILNGVVYYRGQIGKTDGTAFGATSFTPVTALPAEAQPTLGANGYVVTAIATQLNTVSARAYIGATSLGSIVINMSATGATYIDLSGFFYPLG